MHTSLRTCVVAILMFGASQSLSAQTKTVEKRVEIDSATGARRVVYVEAEGKSEDITPYTDMVNINPLKFFIAYNAAYMHKLGSSFSAGLGFEYGTFKELPAWGASAEFRFYPGKKAMHGFYLAPNMSYLRSEENYYYYYPQNRVSQYLTVGLMAGWQWFPYENFPMGLSFGFDDYIRLNAQQHYDNALILGGWYGQGLAPVVRFDLGFAW